MNSIESSDSAANQRITAKRKALEEEEAAIEKRKADVARQGQRELSEKIERIEQDTVKFSQEAEARAEGLKRLQRDQVSQLNLQGQAHVEKLSQDLATRIAALDKHALDAISSHQTGTMERIRASAERREDPFYRLKSFDVSVKEGEKDYEIQVKVPPHEQEKVFVAADRNELKLTLAREFQEKTALEDGRSNKTATHQTVTESFRLPTRVDPSTASREYRDGVLVYRIGKQV
ncbi:MAG: Hsp20/alpha crystallin family protein [Bdellovibrionales bacterium]|nr:Hsp20/alpha crystallin family protein [Bdellovibrionales bacterium]